jgi:tRNA(Ile)-lysidine synthase
MIETKILTRCQVFKETIFLTGSEKLLTSLRRNLSSVLTSGDICLAAVSGGADSVALLFALCEIAHEVKIKVVLAHYDHGIRAESRSDALWVEALAGKTDVEFISERGDVPGLCRREGLGIEEAARKCRYDFLERTARQVGARIVVTAHTSNDQAETVLFRILRGTGVPGLAGIPLIRCLGTGANVPGTAGAIDLLRPLLDCSREDVLAYLQQRNQDYLTDPTNFDVQSQTRARIRHQLLPLLEEEYGPGVSSSLCALADSAGQVRAAIEFAARKVRSDNASAIEQTENGMKLPLKVFETPGPVAVELLLQCLTEQGARPVPNRARLNEALETMLSAQVGKMYLIQDFVIRRQYDCVSIERQQLVASPEGTQEEQQWEVSLDVESQNVLPDGRILEIKRLSVDFCFDEFKREKTPSQEIISASLLTNGLLLCRNRRPGDRFHPLGAEGEKKLKDFFIDKKVPLACRDSVPLVLINDSIVWVCGHRLADWGKIDDNSDALLLLSIGETPNT